MSEFDGLLDDLKENRLALIQSMSGGKSWSDDHVRQLAEIQGAISAVEAQIAEAPVGESGPTIEFGEDGWPVTITT